MIGQILGRFHVVAKLGEGGMGAVWKAHDSLLDADVALKCLPDRLADSADARRRFLREARATSLLKHPGIATLFDAVEIDARLFIATEYVDGTTVAEKLAAGAIPVAEAL